MKKIIILLVLVSFSCDVKEEYKTITIDDKYSLSIPENLEESNNLNDDASLQYQNLLNDFYVIVIDETKESFHSAITESGLDISPDLDGYYQTITANLLDNVKGAKKYDEKATTINGKKAKIFTLSGNVEGFDVFYRYAVVEGNLNYYQIMLWSKQSNETKFKEIMNTSINSFKELGNKGDKLFKE